MTTAKELLKQVSEASEVSLKELEQDYPGKADIIKNFMKKYKLKLVSIFDGIHGIIVTFSFPEDRMELADLKKFIKVLNDVPKSFDTYFRWLEVQKIQGSSHILVGF